MEASLQTVKEQKDSISFTLGLLRVSSALMPLPLIPHSGPMPMFLQFPLVFLLLSFFLQSLPSDPDKGIIIVSFLLAQ